jgi:hypothetical protein
MGREGSYTYRLAVAGGDTLSRVSMDIDGVRVMAIAMAASTNLNRDTHSDC